MATMSVGKLEGGIKQDDDGTWRVQWSISGLDREAALNMSGWVEELMFTHLPRVCKLVPQNPPH